MPFAERADGEMRDAPAVLDPGEQDCLAVACGSRRVEDGVDGIGPVLGREDRVAGVAEEELWLAHVATSVRALMLPPGGERARARAADPCGVEEQRCAMERERRFGAFVLVERVAAEAVAAAAGREVVERLLQAVTAEEPLEGARRPHPVIDRSRDREGGQLRLDQRGGIERLLVAGVRHRLVPAAAAVAGEAERVVAKARLVAEPAERVETELDQVVPVEGAAAAQERLREPCVVVAEPVLEPAPLVGRSATVGLGELLDEPLQQALGVRVETIRVEA